MARLHGVFSDFCLFAFICWLGPHGRILRCLQRTPRVLFCFAKVWSALGILRALGSPMCIHQHHRQSGASLPKPDSHRGVEGDATARLDFQQDLLHLCLRDAPGMPRGRAEICRALSESHLQVADLCHSVEHGVACLANCFLIRLCCRRSQP